MRRRLVRDREHLCVTLLQTTVNDQGLLGRSHVSSAPEQCSNALVLLDSGAASICSVYRNENDKSKLDPLLLSTSLPNPSLVSLFLLNKDRRQNARFSCTSFLSCYPPQYPYSASSWLCRSCDLSGQGDHHVCQDFPTSFSLQKLTIRPTTTRYLPYDDPYEYPDPFPDRAGETKIKRLGLLQLIS